MKSAFPFVAALGLLAVAVPCQAQKPAPVEDLPRAAVTDVKKIPEGGLLLAVRLYAPKTKALMLAHPAKGHSATPKIPARLEGGMTEGLYPTDVPTPFSLAGSTLRDAYTGTTYTALPQLPAKPFFGSMEVATELNPNGSLQMGVAFPPIAAPPDKDGKKQPYELLLEIAELKLRTVIKLDPETLKPLPPGR